MTCKARNGTSLFERKKDNTQDNNPLLYVVDKLTFEGVGVGNFEKQYPARTKNIYAHDYCRCSVNRKKVCWTDTYARTEENNFYCMEELQTVHAYTK